MSSVSKKVQLNISVSADLVARLDNLSAEYRKRGRTQVAEEILEQCIDVYERSEQAKFEFLRSFNGARQSDTEKQQP